MPKCTRRYVTSFEDVNPPKILPSGDLARSLGRRAEGGGRRAATRGRLSQRMGEVVCDEVGSSRIYVWSCESPLSYFALPFLSLTVCTGSNVVMPMSFDAVELSPDMEAGWMSP